MDEVRAGEPTAVDALGAWFDELDVPDDIDWTDEPSQRTLPASAETVIGFALDDAVGCQTLVNIQAARQMFAIREAFEVARQNPRIYVPVGISDRDPKADDVEFAVRSVAFDLAQRLRLSENMVRSLAWQGDVLLTSLPRLRKLFSSGRISAKHVRAATDSTTGIPDELTMAAYDEKVSAIAEALRPGEFARRCRAVRERLCADTLQERHEEAHRQRRVTVESAEDGMAWLNIYAPAIDIAQAHTRLTGEARRLHALPGETRTLDQLRADLAAQFLAHGILDGGTSTGTAARPVLLIDDAGRFAELLGYGPVPPRAAAKALRDAPEFRKVIADPVEPAVLNLDTKRYRPTRDQRTWLTLKYGLDEDAAPYLPTGVAAGGEVDHVIERQHGGPTDVANLVPLKPRLHRLKTVTRIRLDPKPGGGIRVRTPTGYDSDPPPF